MEQILSFKAIQKANNKKYHNIKMGDCPSVKHFHRKGELLYLAKIGKIQELKSEVPFEINIKGEHLCTYIADFTYKKNNEFIVEDVKGRVSAEYAIKRKLINILYNIKILET